MNVSLAPVRARRLRWHAQLLGGSDLTPADVVRRAVALQGQDLRAVLRAIALRSRPGTRIADVIAAFDAGELVRSWPMRGTLFATTPDHLATLLAATSQRLHRATIRRRGELELDEATIGRAGELLGTALTERPMRRSEVMELWAAAGLVPTDGRGYHLIMHWCVAGLAHWGPFDASGSEQLLTLSATPPPADPEAALAGIVHDVIASRGPVYVADLAWWIKLPKATLRRAVATLDDLVGVSVDGVDMLAVGEPGDPEPSGVSLVPGFDEWILGYADRSLQVSPAVLDNIVPGRGGIFRPAILVDGRVVGRWKPARPGSGDEPTIELADRVTAATRHAIATAVNAWPHE